MRAILSVIFSLVAKYIAASQRYFFLKIKSQSRCSALSREIRDPTFGALLILHSPSALSLGNIYHEPYFLSSTRAFVSGLKSGSGYF